MHTKIILTFIIVIITINFSTAQTIPNVSERQIRQELTKRGISEEELLQAMKENGIEVTDINDLSPIQLAQLEQIVKDLEQQKAEETGGDNSEILNKEDVLKAPTKEDLDEIATEIKSFENTSEEVETKTRIYGHQFFRDKSISTFENAKDIKAPPTYILGAGDNLIVSIWGLSQKEFSFEINPDGYISADQRRIFLKGLSLQEAKKKLEQWFSNYYRFNSGEFDVELSYARTVNVSIQGEVENPGGYTIPAINNVFNALIVAGGPTSIGSIREILHIKRDGSTRKYDFYDYLKNPSNLETDAIEEGDIIVIPVSKLLVEVKGGVRRPMIYEMKDSESLEEIINLSGGFSKSAVRDLVQVERFTNNAKRIIDVELSQFTTFNFMDGDVVTVRIIEEEPRNYVTINGAVFNTGRFEKTPSLKLSDLLERSVLKEESRLDLAFIKRRLNNGQINYIPVDLREGSSDLEILLRDEDEITVFNLSVFSDNQEFKVSGAVRNPGSFNYSIDDEISIKKAIELAGGLRRDASGIGIIHSIDPLNPKVKTYRRINLAEVYNNEGETIGAMDSLEVFSQALFDEESYVSVSGAVNSPGRYQFGENMNLGDVFAMSGGFQLGAATNRVEISRLVIEDNEPTKVIIANLSIDRDIESNDASFDFQLEPYDEVIVRYVPEFEMQNIIELRGEVKFPGKYTLIKDNETIKDVILRAGGLTIEAYPEAAKLVRKEDSLGNVVLKLDEVMNSNSSRFNFNLKDGDVISIPKVKDFVSISGATNAQEMYTEDILGAQRQLNVPFHNGKNAKFYLDNYAGGISDRGNKNEVYVQYVNGEVVKSKNFLLYRTYPEVKKGSKIIVGYKPIETDSEEKEKVDWTQVLNDSVAQAMSVLTLLLLIERL